MTSRRLLSVHRRVVTEIVAEVVPAYPELDHATRVRVCADVTDFVESQISALPPFLRVPYQLAIGAFQLLPVLRYGRTFGGLGTEARQRCLAFWSAGTLPFTAEFTKVIRSCSLLAYFDHPDVRGRLGPAASSSPLP